MAYNTGNPIGSKDPRDLADNAENFDKAVNTEGQDSWTDRLGRPRKTWDAIEREAAELTQVATEQADRAEQEADRAEQEADRAEQEADRAELARDAALIQAGVYETEEDGRAAVADGEAFKVQGTGDVAAYEYRRVNSSSSTLIATYPSKSLVDRVAKQAQMPIVDAVGVMAYDTFSRADGSIGDAESGQAWDVITGSMSVSSGKVAGSKGIGIIDVEETDVDITVRFDPVESSDAGIVLHAIDGSNYLQVRLLSTAIRVTKTEGGSDTALINVNRTVSTSGLVVIRVRSVGARITVWHDGEQIIDYTLGSTDYSTFGASTKFGLYLRRTSRAASIVISEADTTSTEVDRVNAWLPHVLGNDVRAYDGFHRGDGAIGTADSGAAWSVLSGTMSISSNKASGVSGVAVIDVGEANVDVTAFFDPPGASNSRIIFRAIDADNLLYARILTDAVRIVVVDGGSETVLSNVAEASIGANPLELRVVAKGREARVYVNGVQKIQHSFSTAVHNKFGAATKVGLGLHNPARVSWFVARMAEAAADVGVDSANRATRMQFTSHYLRKLAFHAAKHHEATATAVIDDFDLDFPPEGWNYFRGAVVAPDGAVYVIMRDSGYFVIFETDGSVTQTDLGLSPAELALLNQSGGCLGPDGKIYSPPRDGGYVVVIDPVTRTAALKDYGIDLSPSTLDKWTGAVCGPDGRIYCLPTSGKDILVIEPDTDRAWRTNYGLSWSGGLSFAGGCVGPDGKIYLPPYNNNTGSKGVLVIDPMTQTATFEFYGLDLSGTARWAGCVVGADGRIYCCPRRAGKVLIIDPFRREAFLEDFGLDLEEGENKWARFITGPDGKLYATPQDATDILVVDPLARTAVRTNLGLTLPNNDQKWIGGVLAPDGRIICTPDTYRGGFLIIDVDAPPLDDEVVMCPLLNKSP